VKVIAVAGVDPGATLHLRALVEEAVQRLGLAADVQMADMVTARLTAQEGDVIVTIEPIADELASAKAHVVGVHDTSSSDEVVAGLASFLVETGQT